MDKYPYIPWACQSWPWAKRVFDWVMVNCGDMARFIRPDGGFSHEYSTIGLYLLRGHESASVREMLGGGFVHLGTAVRDSCWATSGSMIPIYRLYVGMEWLKTFDVSVYALALADVLTGTVVLHDG